MSSPPLTSSLRDAPSTHDASQNGLHPPSLVTASTSILRHPPSTTQTPTMIVMQTPYGPISVPMSSLPAASPNPALALQHDPSVLLQMQLLQAQMQHLQPHYNNMMGPSFFNGMAMAPPESSLNESSAAEVPDSEMDGTAFLEALFGSNEDMATQDTAQLDEVEDEEAKAKLRDLAMLMSPTTQHLHRSRENGPLSPSRHSEPPRDPSSAAATKEAWARRSPTLKIATSAQPPSGDMPNFAAVSGRAPSATVYVNPRFVPKHGGSIDLNALTTSSSHNATSISSLPKVLPKFNLEKLPFIVPIPRLADEEAMAVEKHARIGEEQVTSQQDAEAGLQQATREKEAMPQETEAKMEEEDIQPKAQTTTDALSRWHAVIKALIDEEQLPSQEQWWTATVSDLFPRSNLPPSYTVAKRASVSLPPGPPRERNVSHGLSSPQPFGPTIDPPREPTEETGNVAPDAAATSQPVAPIEQPLASTEHSEADPATREGPTSSPLLKRKAALMVSQENLASLDAPSISSPDAIMSKEETLATPEKQAEDHPLSPLSQPSRRHSMAVLSRAHLDAASDRRHSIDITSPTSEISSKHVPKTFAAIRSSRLNPAFQAASVDTTRGLHGYMWGGSSSSDGPEVQKRRSASIQPSWGKSWLTGSSSSSPSSQPLEDDLVMEDALSGLEEANGRKRASLSAVPKPIKRVTEAIKRHRAPSLEKTLKLQEKLQALQAQFKSQQKAKVDTEAIQSASTATSLASSPALLPFTLSADSSPAVLPSSFGRVADGASMGSGDPPPFALGHRQAEDAMQLDEEDPTGALPDFVPIDVTSSSSLSMVFAGGIPLSQSVPSRNGWTANKGGVMKRGTKSMQPKRGLTSPTGSTYAQPPPPPARHEHYAMQYPQSMAGDDFDARAGPSPYAYGGPPPAAYGAEGREGYSPLRRMSYDPAALRERYHYDAYPGQDRSAPPPLPEKQYYFGYTETPQGDQRRPPRGGPPYHGASQPLSSLPPSMWKASANDRRGSWQGPTTYYSDHQTPRSFHQGGPMKQDEHTESFRRQEPASHQPIYQRDANWGRSYPSRS